MYFYIVNPVAGNSRTRQNQDKLRVNLRAIGIDGEFARTTGPGDATRLTKHAIEKGYTTIVAVGGDGTVNEVINGIGEANVAVGVMPLGHTNAVAAQLGITGWQQACRALAERRVNEYNLIAAGQNVFISTLTLGFETELDKQLEAPATSRRQRVKQLQESLVHAHRFSTLACTLKTESFTMKAEAFSLSVVNRKFLDPMAADQLSVTLSERPGTRARAGYVWQLMHGISPLEESATTRFLAKRVVIETEPPTGITVDGKLVGRTPIAIRLTDRKVRLIVGKAARELA